MASFCHAELLIDPLTPLSVAEALLKFTVPKFASGRTPPEEGASAIHSAELRAALREDRLILKCPPVLVLSRISVKEPLPLKRTSALITLPGCTARPLITWLAFGYISYQA